MIKMPIRHRRWLVKNTPSRPPPITQHAAVCTPSHNGHALFTRTNSYLCRCNITHNARLQTVQLNVNGHIFDGFPKNQKCSNSPANRLFWVFPGADLLYGVFRRDSCRSSNKWLEGNFVHNNVCYGILNIDFRRKIVFCSVCYKRKRMGKKILRKSLM